MSENDVARKLEKLGLVLNHPEPALICSQCKYALQLSGVRVSRHLAERDSTGHHLCSQPYSIHVMLRDPVLTVPGSLSTLSSIVTLTRDTEGCLTEKGYKRYLNR